MKNYFKIIKVLFFIFVLNTVLFANIATVVKLKGKANVSRGVEDIALSVDDTLLEGDTIVTKGKTRVQIKFEDNTRISLGSNSKLHIDEYIYDSRSKSSATFSTKLGFFKVITGAIGKVNPKNFIIKTKTSTIGIRGTVFTINDYGDLGTVVACIEGKVIVTSKDTGKVVVLEHGNMSEINLNTAPTDAKKFDISNFENNDFYIKIIILKIRNIKLFSICWSSI